MFKTKKFLSTILVLAMILSFIPGMALATTGDTVTLQFNKAICNGGNSTNQVSVANELYTAEDAMYDVVGDKTTSKGYGGSNTSYLSVLGGIKGGDSKAWINQETPIGQFTIKTKNASLPAGNYKVTMDKENVYNTGGMVYVYIDGKYVGFYDSWASGMNSAKDKAIPVGYISVSEEEAASGVEIMFTYAARSNGNNGTNGAYIIMKTMSFEEVETIPAYSAVELNVLDEGVTEFPTELAIDATATFNAKAQLTDGSYRHLNGYAADKSEDSDNKITVVSSDESILKVEILNDFTDSSNMYKYDGEAAYKLTGIKDGDATLTITATIDGVAQTPVVKSVKVGAGTVVEPEPEPEPTDEPVYLFFGSSYMDRNDTNADGTKSSNELTAKADVGYTLIAGETTPAIYGSGSYCIAPLGGKNGTDLTTWVEYRHNSDTDNYGQITISTDKLEAGSYKVSVADYAYMNSDENRGGKVYVYVGGKYAGLYNGSDLTGIIAPSSTSDYVDVGYVTLTEADVASGTKIRFCFAGRGDEAVSKSLYMPLSGIKLEKSDAPTEYTIDSKFYSVDDSQNLTLINDLSALSSLTFGTRTDVSVKLNERHLNNYDANGAYDENNAIIVTSSNSNVISVTDLEVATQNSRMVKYSDTPSYALSAVGGGKTIITATAYIDGNEVAKETFEVTVDGPVIEDYDITDVSTVTYSISSNFEEIMDTSVITASVGAEVTLTAPEDNSDYTFVGWMIGSYEESSDELNGNRFITDEAKKTVNVWSNTAFTAVYVPKNSVSSDPSISFWNYDGTFLGKKSVLEIENEGGLPTTSLTGYSALKWIMADEEQLTFEAVKNLDADTNVVAQYDEAYTDICVSINDKEDKLVFDEMVTYLRNDYISGNTVPSHWKRDGEIVRFSADYNYFAWAATTVEPCYGTVEKTPVVMLDKNAVDGAYMIEYDVADQNAFEIVEAGILFGKSGEPLVSSRAEVFTSKKSGVSHNQLSAKPENEDNTCVRGYIIYKIEASGEYKVRYTKTMEIDE